MANWNAEILLEPTIPATLPPGTQIFKLQAEDIGGPGAPLALSWTDTVVSTRYAPSVFGGPFINLEVLDTWFL